MSELLLELYSEEIPSRMQKSAISQLKSKLESLDFVIIKALISPCRMVICANVENKNAQKLILTALGDIKWPKLMNWGLNSKWIRPIRSILCLVDGKLLKFDFMGVSSSDFTFAHKTLVGKKLYINSVEDYFDQLEKNFVIVDQDRRRKIILSEVEKHIETNLIDMDLVEDMVGLTEYPCPCKVSFSEKFLATIPKEIIYTTVKYHQKCLVIHKNNEISNEFINVSNVPVNEEIIAGYQRVITARLSNAEFLYRDELKKSLADRLDDLDMAIYYKGLGSLKDKALRIGNIANIIASSISNDKIFIQFCVLAGLLSKADLSSNTVKEFPELQGVIGYYLFLNSNIKDCIKTVSKYGLIDINLELDNDYISKIASAIRNHYYPQGIYAKIDNLVTVVVALADKIDTLSSFWSINQKPTGSKDPFALRRMCIGLVKILLEENIDLNLEKIISEIGNKNIDLPDILNFINKRVEVIFADQYGYNKKYFASLEHLNNPVKQLNHLKILSKFNGIKDIEFVYKRLVKFFKGKKINYLFSVDNQSQSVTYSGVIGIINKEDFANLENSLLGKIKELILLGISNNVDKFMGLSTVVNKIFDNVVIGNDKNKLMLLQLVLLIIREFADFSKI